MIGPWRVWRTRMVNGSSSPATAISSEINCMSCQVPWYSYCIGLSGFTRSMNRSWTSGPRLVTPQAMRALWPMTTPGTPAKEAPTRS